MDFMDAVRNGFNFLLTWIGYGTVVGLVAKAILPGKDPGGAVATVIVGILGAIMGAGTLLFFWEGARVSPISPFGFVVATLGAILLLIVYRLLAGRIFREGGYDTPGKKRFRRRVVVNEE